LRPLSYTQISTYQACPLSYRLQYIDGLKPKDKWYFSFGKTLHKCTEYFYKVKVPPPPSLAELLDYYEANWIAEAYESEEEEARYRAYGRELLTRFWEINHPDFQMPLAVERMFNIDIDGIKLRGYIDRIDKLESGGLAIVDYKTSQNLFTADDLGEDLQLTLYQVAVEEMWQLPVTQLTLYHLRSNTPCSCGPRDAKQLEAARGIVRDVARKIAAGDFPATENQYCPCDFPEYCPYYQHLYPDAVPVPARQDMLPGLAASEAVEEYVALQAQAKEIEERLKALRQQIIDFCEASGLQSIYGSEHAITYRRTARTGYDEAGLQYLLEATGSWERVLSFDAAKLKELLASDEIPEDIKCKIEALKTVIAESPRLWVKKLAPEE